MTDSSWISVVLLVAFGFVLMAMTSVSRTSLAFKQAVLFGTPLRLVGAFLYTQVLEEYYGGGDYRIYFPYGLDYASRMSHGDFSMFWNRAEWYGSGSWWGSQFINFVTGISVWIVGPSMLAVDMVFALIAFAGLLLMVGAFRRAFPQTPLYRYAAWLALFPSLWFWPSVIGKEAIVIFGLGLSTFGFVGRSGRIQWIPLLFGLAAITAIRPQLTLVVMVAMAGGVWLALGGKWNASKTFQAIAIIVVAYFGLRFAAKSLGMENTDTDTVATYMHRRAKYAATGQHNVVTAVGASGVPDAVVKILFRPFPWEARKASMMLSSIEVVMMWAIVFLRRRDVYAALKLIRRKRVIAFGVLFVFAYSATLGMLAVNLGLIARQRIFIFPFLFMLVEAVPRRARSRSPAPVPVPAAASGPHPTMPARA